MGNWQPSRTLRFCVCKHTDHAHDGDVFPVEDGDGIHFARALGPCSYCECPTFDLSASDATPNGSSSSIGGQT